MTVSEPMRDDDEYDALELVPCPTCEGSKKVSRPRAYGGVERVRCRECKRDPYGRVLRGNPPEAKYCLTLSYGVPA